MDSLSGKVAVVTGGTRGIGRAIAERLLREGAAVAICGRTRGSVDRAVAAMRPLGPIFGYPADIARAEEVRSFFEAVDREFSGLDILINNAAQGVFRKAAEMTPEEWHRNIDINLNGAFYCSREALARFLKRGGGFIVNISSLAGNVAFTGGAGYNASKAGLNLFADAIMLDHRNDNVRVCTVLPGSVDTNFGGRQGGADWMIAPEDIAESVAMVLRMPARTMVSRIEMRPTKPQK
jgi:NAD(P)-dependent dehydrogenase (short-subunit alcohol dehydrogenase family)